ncbi:MAG TPA: hypothetical protein VGG19_09910 [Tepidisphaeraceae bacterium]|jgi:hypothetical protein
MGFWQNTLSSLLAGVGTILTVAVLRLIVPLWKRGGWFKRIFWNPNQPITEEYVPNRTFSFLVAVLLFTGIGIFNFADWFYRTATTVPQKPFGHPASKGEMVVVGGLLISLLGVHIFLKLMVVLFPPRWRKKKMGLRVYTIFFVVVSLFYYVMLLFAYFDPFGWATAFINATTP